MKLRTKLIITFLLLSIVPVIIMAYLGYTTDRRVIEEELGNHLISTNILKSSQLDRWVDNNKNSLEELAQRPLVREKTDLLMAMELTDTLHEETRDDILQNHPGRPPALLTKAPRRFSVPFRTSRWSACPPIGHQSPAIPPWP